MRKSAVADLQRSICKFTCDERNRDGNENAGRDGNDSVVEI